MEPGYACEFYLDNLRKSIDELRQLEKQYKALEKSSNSENIQRVYDEFKKKYSGAKDHLKSLKKHKRELDSQTKKEVTEQYKELSSVVQKLKENYDVSVSIYQKEELTTGGSSTVNIKTSAKALASRYQKTAEENVAISDNLVATVQETDALADSALQQAQENQDAASRILNKGALLSDDLKKARKLVNRYRRNLETDKLIWVFTFLIFASIVGIIIYSTVNPSQTMFR
eukprot:g4066.t1